jgi:putative DNA primase/helicase
MTTGDAADCPVGGKSPVLPAPQNPDSGTEQDEFRYGQTDLGNSERFIRLHARDLRYCMETSTWYIWSSTHWQVDKLKQVHQRAKATIKAMYAELAIEADDEKRKTFFKFIQKSESERSLYALVNLAKTDPRIAISVQSFDTQPHLLNALNGTIDLGIGELLPHRRDDLITKLCPVIYDPSATSEVWDQFLDDCTNNDPQLKSFVQRAVGSTLFGDSREQLIFMVIGPGKTGKSTFLAVILAILGDYAATADFSTFLKKDRTSGSASDDIASLAGARLVSSIEVEEGQKLAEALLKQLTGGDVIRARHLYQSSFEFKPQFTLWLVCNHAPLVKHDDDAIWRRILRLPFENVVPPDKLNTNLKAVLTDVTTTGPAVLAWAVRGYLEWQRIGPDIPASVQNATEQYKTDSNPLVDFVAEACVRDPTAFIKTAELRHAYDEWCRQNGEKVSLTRNQFAKALEELGFFPVNKSVGRSWEGVALRADARSLYLVSNKGSAKPRFNFPGQDSDSDLKMTG